MIEIIEAAPETQPVEGMKAAGLRHLALAVSDFAAVHAKLVEKGVRFLTDKCRRWKATRQSFSWMRDGNILHLLHRETPLP